MSAPEDPPPSSLDAEIQRLRDQLWEARTGEELTLRKLGAMEERVHVQARALRDRRAELDKALARAEAVENGWHLQGYAPNLIRSYWQSAVVMRELNRRITGNPDVSPGAHLVTRCLPAPCDIALSPGRGSGSFEAELLAAGACEHVVLLAGPSESGSRRAANVTPELRERVDVRVSTTEDLAPDERYPLIVVQGLLDLAENPALALEPLLAHLAPAGILYIDEYLGPVGSPGSVLQVEIVNRLLATLSEALRVDLVERAGRVKGELARPAPDSTVTPPADNVISYLADRLEPIEVKAYGGAIFPLLFNRIMGNFAGNDDLVRTIVEFDWLLTDAGVVPSDFLWAVYRAPAEPAEPDITESPETVAQVLQ